MPGSGEEGPFRPPGLEPGITLLLGGDVRATIKEVAVLRSGGPDQHAETWFADGQLTRLGREKGKEVLDGSCAAIACCTNVWKVKGVLV